jgi:hypothetical protein
VTARAFSSVSGAVACILLASGTAFALDVVDIATSQLNKPYQWGASGPGSFDCSGLTQYVFGQVGVQISRRAISQSMEGELVTGPLERGDLLFFSTDDAHPGIVTHVGIYEGGNFMIDASSHTETIKREDITSSYWTSRFLFARRVVPNVTESDGQSGFQANGEWPLGSPSGVDTLDGNALAASFAWRSAASSRAPGASLMHAEPFWDGACVWPGDAPRISRLAQFASLRQMSQGEGEFKEAPLNVGRPYTLWLDDDHTDSGPPRVNQRDGPLGLSAEVSHIGSGAGRSGPGALETRAPSTWPDL